MDLGIKGKSALICAASKGLGKGCAFSLAREGVNVTILARGREALEATADEIRKATGVKVTVVVLESPAASRTIRVQVRVLVPEKVMDHVGCVEMMAGPPGYHS